MEEELNRSIEKMREEEAAAGSSVSVAAAGSSVPVAAAQEEGAEDSVNIPVERLISELSDVIRKCFFFLQLMVIGVVFLYAEGPHDAEKLQPKIFVRLLSTVRDELNQEVLLGNSLILIEKVTSIQKELFL